MSTTPALVDVEAERAVLGGMLLNPELVAQAEALIQPRHMSSDRNRAIFSAILAVHERGTEPDLVTVRGELSTAGLLEAAGGVPYLSSLLDGMPRVLSVETWAQQVREKARRRAALDMVRRAAQQCEGGEDGTDEIIDALRVGLERLNDAGTRGIQPIKEVLVEAMRDLEAFVAAPRGLTGCPTGIADLDRMTSGLKPGQLWIVAAFTSRGKSSLCTQISVTAAAAGERVLMFSMEMPPPDVVQRMLLARAGVDKWHLRTQQDRGWPRLAAAVGPISALPLWFDPRECPTASDVRSAALRHKATVGCELIVVDHLQRMSRDPKQQGDDWLAVGQNVQALKSLARRLNIPVLCACQLNSEAEDKRPTMAHLSRARGIISQEADVIAFLHPKDMKEWNDRSVMRPSVDLLIDKQRGGPCGDVPLIFERGLTQFYGVADERQTRTASLPYKDE